MQTVVISADKGIPKSQLDALSLLTSLPLATPNTPADFQLHITTDKLELRKIESSQKKTKSHHKNRLSISVDFTQGKAQHRRLHGGGKGQYIAKAIGLHKISNPDVLDLTAGMGGDSFVLATLGANMTMLERNPIVHALLKDALNRAKLKDDDELQKILAHMTLLKQNALDYLTALDEPNYPDVIYFDPMFPSRNKSAQVKKEMQFFHDIVGNDDDAESILLLALEKSKKRIVVKRPRLAEKLTNKRQTAFEITGKSTRYDVYLPKKIL